MLFPSSLASKILRFPLISEIFSNISLAPTIFCGDLFDNLVTASATNSLRFIFEYLIVTFSPANNASLTLGYSFLYASPEPPTNPSLPFSKSCCVSPTVHLCYQYV